jgi:hypothetical protein
MPSYDHHIAAWTTFDCTTALELPNACWLSCHRPGFLKLPFYGTARSLQQPGPSGSGAEAPRLPCLRRGGRRARVVRGTWGCGAGSWSRPCTPPTR